ncbi:hypothetical protein D3C74_436680 [compost metagenome]
MEDVSLSRDGYEKIYNGCRSCPDGAKRNAFSGTDSSLRNSVHTHTVPDEQCAGRNGVGNHGVHGQIPAVPDGELIAQLVTGSCAVLVNLQADREAGLNYGDSDCIALGFTRIPSRIVSDNCPGG